MEKLTLILVSSIYITSCSGNKRDLNEIVMTTEDYSVNQFVLRDTSAFDHLDILPDKIDDPNIGEFIVFSNESTSEYLLLVSENGGLKNQYNYFYLTDSIPIEYAEKMVVLSDSVFYTTLGAHIGLSEIDFMEKYKGIDFHITQNETGNIYEFQDTSVLYHSSYRFVNGQLTHIEFGYVW